MYSKPLFLLSLAGALTAATLTAQRLAADAAGDRTLVRAGIADVSVDPAAAPGAVAAFGSEAFVVLSARQEGRRVPVVAGTRYGGGRAIATGHGAFFNATSLKSPATTRLLTNVVSWLGGKRFANVRLGVAAGDADALRAAGCRVVPLDAGTLAGRLSEVDVLSLYQDTLDGARHQAARRALLDWVRKGGGLIVHGPAWGWAQTHPGQSLAADQSGNQLLVPMGLALTDGIVEIGEDANVTPAVLDRIHAGRALTALRDHVGGGARLDAGALTDAVGAIAAAVNVLPPDEPLLVKPTRDLIADRVRAAVVPTRAQPVGSREPLRRLKLVLDGQDLRRQDTTVTAHPAAADFPGAVPSGARRVERTISVDTAVKGWHSTGLYAAPGESITVRLPGQRARPRIAVRIGAHTDTLWHLDKWERFPEITVRRSLGAGETRVASAFGGPIYLDVADNVRAGTLEFNIGGAVEAPYFVKGKTTPREWDALRRAPAPWAELVGERIILTVPSTAVRELRNPQAVMVYWDEVAALCDTLYARPRTGRGPDRYCVDRQISAGYMHSGYPIMTGDDVTARFVDLAVLRGKKGEPNWGFYHELGHNYQESDWTFDGTGEVTNNLFSLYACEKLNGDRVGHPDLAGPTEQRLKKYLTDGAPYARWKDDPFLALTMYIQLQREFGWEPFTRVFTEYRALPAGERPKSDEDRRDQWMTRMSRAVGRNLGPFFRRWGVPVSDSARAAVQNLPRWLPAELR